MLIQVTETAHNPQAQIQAVGTGSYDAALTFKTAVGGSDNNTPKERLRITSAGSVGIGTDNPSGKLHVSDGANGLEFNVNSQNATVSYDRETLFIVQMVFKVQLYH